MPPPTLSPLQALLTAPMRPGKLIWIGIRPARNATPLTPQSARLIAERGIEGDHYQSSRNGARQVTIISNESLAAIGAYLGRDPITPDILRRNIVTQGVNLSALKGRRFRIGAALLEYSGECAPCSRMETALGPGGYNAVRGHGGITARIIAGGEMRIGSEIIRVD